MRLRYLTGALVAGTALWLATGAPASAAGTASTQATPQSTAPHQAQGHKQPSGHSCPLGTVVVQSNPIAPIVNLITGDKTDQACNVVRVAGGAASNAAGSAVKAVAGDVMDQVSSWMVGAAETIGGWVSKAMSSTTTPELTSAWYQSEFGYLAMFGAALAGIVALLGLLSAALRQDPYALGEIFYGIFRAGVVTALAVSLTLLALKVADGISADVLRYMPQGLFQTLSSAWGKSGWGGLGSSALAFLLALAEVLIGVLVWIELLFRDAAIYVAVLFLPVTLAVAIWPRLASVQAKLMRVLGVFVALKPVMLIVLMTGGNLLAGGISFYGGLGPSVGTIISGLIVLAMAGFAPWALMHLLGMEVGAMGVASGRGRAGRAAGSPATREGPIGGDLVAGPVAGVATSRSTSGMSAASHNPQGGGALARSAGRGGQNGGDASATSSRRLPVPGAVAAAAGWLPAVSAAGQNLAGHGAARVHTAGGHGGYPPSSAPWQTFASRPSESRSSGRIVGEPVGPPDTPPTTATDSARPVVGGPEPRSGADSPPSGGSNPPTTPDRPNDTT